MNRRTWRGMLGGFLSTCALLFSLSSIASADSAFYHVSSETVFTSDLVGTIGAGVGARPCVVGSTLVVTIPVSTSLHMSFHGGDLFQSAGSGAGVVFEMFDGSSSYVMCDGGMGLGSRGWCYSHFDGGTSGDMTPLNVDYETPVLPSGSYQFCFSSTANRCSNSFCRWRVWQDILLSTGSTGGALQDSTTPYLQAIIDRMDYSNQYSTTAAVSISSGTWVTEAMQNPDAAWLLGAFLAFVFVIGWKMGNR